MSAKLTVTLVILVMLCALEDEAGLDLNFIKCIIILKTIPFFFTFTDGISLH